jgi:uncharacterized protein YbjT (DUF2867 family)
MPTDARAITRHPAPATQRVALVAGATGLVGHSLLTLLTASGSYRAVHALVRHRPSTPVGLAADPRINVHTVDFGRLDATPLPALDDAYIALGTTIKAAGSETAFRAVDFDAVLATARAAKAAGARRLAVVSALGADHRSRVFYNRVKGEMEAAVAALGFETLVLAQPSLLIGDRAALGQPTRRGERWAMRLVGPVLGFVPKSIRPIEAETVARALLRTTLAGRPGLTPLDSAALQAAGQH